MDEIEFLRTFNNLRILIDDLKDEPRIRNAMLVMAALLDGLNQRVMELASEELDDPDDE